MLKILHSPFSKLLGDELIYLDPHTTQQHNDPMEDGTYHCSHPSRMAFSQLDPSIALVFDFKLNFVISSV